MDTLHLIFEMGISVPKKMVLYVKIGFASGRKISAKISWGFTSMDK